MAVEAMICSKYGFYATPPFCKQAPTDTIVACQETMLAVVVEVWELLLSKEKSRRRRGQTAHWTRQIPGRIWRSPL